MPELPLPLVLSATQGRLLAPAAPGSGPPACFPGVSTDSRTVAPGELFVALRGANFDGHDFVPQAFARGAAAALVAREIRASGWQILVGDTLLALGALARAHRLRLRELAPSPPVVVAVTGSTGKTTTKEMIASILSQGWNTVRTPGNYNNEVGVPLALLALEPCHQAAVLELAMRGRGQIAYLADMVQPHIGVITNIGLSHLELLGSREAIAEAKAELLMSLPPDGVAVLNADSEWYLFLRARAPGRVVSFGQTEGADVRVEEVSLDDNGLVSARLRGWWGAHHVQLRAAGRHQALNAAAAAAAAMAAGASPEWIEPGLAAFEAADMRGQLIRAPAGYTIIADCYNAAPDSMRVALELLADLPGGRKWAVLGDMKELGPLAEDWHREVGRMAAAAGLAGLFTVGELGRLISEAAAAVRPAADWEVAAFSDNQAAAAALRQRIAAGDVVLVKGSRAMKMEEIVAALTAPGGGKP